MPSWPALAAAQAGACAPRVPLRLEGRRAGSVAQAHLPALRRLAPAFGPGLRIEPAGVEVTLPRGERSAAFARLNAALRDEGLIAAWRDEPFAVWLLPEAVVAAIVERATARFWGTLTLGAHANGYVADAAGRPTHLWIAQRALSKATDPGKLDNLIGAGVPHGQTPWQAVVREAWEEAGLTPGQAAPAQAGRVIELRRDIPEGFQHEWLYVFDLALPARLQPANQDGEVQSFRCLPVHEAIDVAAGSEMTTDAALVTLDFALRHQLLGDTLHAELAARAAPLWVQPPAGALAAGIQRI
jgi:8-oxo-dGTP pyrophosphatase MutT (NUDIX family)